MSDAVNHPSHYTLGGVEVIDAIEAWELGFHLGNAVKYIARAGRKGDRLEDLRKARWYLEREIARLDPPPAVGEAPVTVAALKAENERLTRRVALLLGAPEQSVAR